MEIIQTARALFEEFGYGQTSVEAIIKKMNVAKGTFYYYFESKAKVLAAIVQVTLDQMVEMAQQLADHPDMDALGKLSMLLAGGSVDGDENAKLVESLHLPANRELHELTNVQTILRLSPIFAQIVAQGNQEGVFNVPHPLETVQFLLTGTQFLLDGGLFDFSAREMDERRVVAQGIIEKALGAKPGSFGFMNSGAKS